MCRYFESPLPSIPWFFNLGTNFSGVIVVWTTNSQADVDRKGGDDSDEGCSDENGVEVIQIDDQSDSSDGTSHRKINNQKIKEESIAIREEVEKEAQSFREKEVFYTVDWPF